jgi:hypothetical protein
VLWASRHMVRGEQARPNGKGWRKGQPPTRDPRAILLKAQGCRREGIGEEVPNIYQSVQLVLMEQRISLV